MPTLTIQQEQVMARIKNDMNFYDTTDYKEVHEILLKKYNSVQCGKVSRFGLTPSELSDESGSVYIDIRVCGKVRLYDNDMFFQHIAIDDTAVMQVNTQGEISFHSRENIEKKVYDQPLLHITVEKALRGPRTQPSQSFSSPASNSL